MFNNKMKEDSVAKAVSEILESEYKNIKIPTATGTKVLGKNDSARHMDDGRGRSIDRVFKGPKNKDIIDIENEKDNDHEHNKMKEDKSYDFKSKLLEREMTSAETKKKEKIVMSMKDNQGYFKKKYGSRWKEVMYATATKKAMGEELNYEEVEQLDEISAVSHQPSAESDMSTDTLSGRKQGVAKANDFKSFKVKIEGDGITRPQDGQVAKDATAARASIEAHGGPVAQPAIKVGEEVELEESKDPMMDAGVGSDSQFVQNANPSSNPSPKKLSPMERVKALAKNAMKRQVEVLGKAPGNN